MESGSFKQLGYNSLWGHAAPPHLNHASPEFGFRGKATGVSLHTCFPVQCCTLSQDNEWYLGGRLLHTFVKFGSWDVQCVVLYGFPSCQPQSKSRTNNLLQTAIDLVRLSDLPFVIFREPQSPPGPHLMLLAFCKV